MNAFYVLCALLLTSVCRTTTLTRRPEAIQMNCPSVCPRNYNPICATDGVNGYKYFHNECLMHQANCHAAKIWILTQMSLCWQQVDDAIVRDECIRICTTIYTPICATDGNAYAIFGNQCWLQMENCLADESGKWIEVQASDCGI